jgi:hypothetical protein
MYRRLALVLDELKNHAPFTLFGAVTGIAMMLVFRNLPEQTTFRLFYVFHPLHVLLSAVVAASLFRLHEKTRRFFVILVVGYLGAVGVATLSDCIIPYYGESLLGVAVPTESKVHGSHAEEASPAGEQHPGTEPVHDGKPKLHLGFIEEWQIVNPAALLGILIAFFLPRTRLPHAGHILISTWASAAHIMMNTHSAMSATTLVGMFIVLFIAVWLPCCFSDIIFPMLLVGDKAGHIHDHHHCCCSEAGHEHKS